MYIFPTVVGQTDVNEHGDTMEQIGVILAHFCYPTARYHCNSTVAVVVVVAEALAEYDQG